MDSKSNELFNSLVDTLKPRWQPNDIIRMFHEERAKIELRGYECKNLLAKADNILGEALSLKDLYTHISPKTSQLHSDCKDLIDERNELQESFEKISFNLGKQEELRGIVKRMPEIRNQIISMLKSISQTFQTQNRQHTISNTSDLADLTSLDEYYGRFFVECRRIRELTGQLELCLACATNEVLIMYLEEIYRLYVDIREQMMQSIFSKNLQTLVARSDRNYCDLMQQSCSLLTRIMRNEIQLFQQVFPHLDRKTKSQDAKPTQLESSQAPGTDDDQLGSEPVLDKQEAQSRLSIPSYEDEAIALKKQALNEMLDHLCMIFYENLRAVVIHINHLETLSELYKLMQETIMHEFNDKNFQSTISLLVEDIQERMAFRTEIFIKESITDYNPSQGDLAYPEKFDLVPGGELNEHQSMWYPTVQRTVLALYYLNRVFDPITFRDLARDLVLACYQSLDMAQNLVDQRHGGSKIEASVFMSKHSAIIINQLQSYGIDQSELPPPPPLLACDRDTTSA